MCGACVKVRRCASASFGSGTARNVFSASNSSAELRKPKRRESFMSGEAASTTLEKKKNRTRQTGIKDFIGLLRCSLQVAQRRQSFCKIRFLVDAINPFVTHFTNLIDNKHGALAGSAIRFTVPQHAILLAHLAMRPEIAAQKVIERTDVALPRGDVHDRIDR